MRQEVTSPFPPLAPRNGVLVADGFGIYIGVRHGRLLIRDGVAGMAREGEFSRATRGFKRLVLLGHTGVLTLEAIRWLSDVGAPLVHLDRDGRLLATSGSLGLDHPVLRRAQALAASSPLGLEIARRIVTQKLRGQAAVLARMPSADEARQDVKRAATHLEMAKDLTALRVAEAAGAAAYCGAWEMLPARFARADAAKVPEYWLTFGRRSSPLTGSPRSVSRKPRERVASGQSQAENYKDVVLLFRGGRQWRTT